MPVVDGRRFLRVALVIAAAATWPSRGNAQEGNAGSGASILLGAGAGVAPQQLGSLLQAHAGAGLRRADTTIAFVSDVTYTRSGAFFGDWTISRIHLGFGAVAVRWLSPSWRLDLHGLVGPAFDTLSGVSSGDTSRTRLVWTAGIGGGWEWLGTFVRYQGGRGSICSSQAACYGDTGGVQIGLTATIDLLR